MVIDLLEFVVRNLRENVGRWPEISEESKVPYSTVAKIGQGETENPRVESVQKLADYFARKAAPAVPAPEPAERAA